MKIVENTINRKIVRDIIKVAFSNIAILFSGVIVTFILPKIIGVTGFGYFKTYTLYITYVGVFHFGIVDGIHLKYSGCDYRKLNKAKFNYYTKFLILLELIISIVLLTVPIYLFKENSKYIIYFLIIYLFFHNITSYYQGISNATSRFGELSLRNIIQSTLIIITVTSIWFVKINFGIDISYITYLICFSVIVIFLSVWYLFTYQDITFNNDYGNYVSFNDIVGFIANGFPLMLANLCSTLLLTVDRQFVNIFFDIDTYAIYAFAYNMLSLMSTATSAVAVVFYPKIKQTDNEKLKKIYPELITTVLELFFCALIIYFPLNLFVKWFLPQYASSLSIFRVIFPGFAISSAITIIMHNYYKALDYNNLFLKKTMLILALSFLLNFIVYKIYSSTIAISIASMIIMLIWYYWIEYFFINRYKIKWKKNYAYILLSITGFYIITGIDNCYISAAIYAFYFIIITFLFDKKRLLLYFRIAKKNKLI